jgi:hypothetical protein
VVAKKKKEGKVADLLAGPLRRRLPRLSRVGEVFSVRELALAKFRRRRSVDGGKSSVVRRAEPTAKDVGDSAGDLAIRVDDLFLLACDGGRREGEFGISSRENARKGKRRRDDAPVATAPGWTE